MSVSRSVNGTVSQAVSVSVNRPSVSASAGVSASASMPAVSDGWRGSVNDGREPLTRPAEHLADGGTR
jgi:hypothetical protein